MPSKRPWRARHSFGLTLMTWLSLAVIAVLLYTGAKTYLENRAVNREISRLKEQAATFESQNQELRQAQERTLSNNFFEKEARVKLNLQKPGETAVFIERSDNSTVVNAQDFTSDPWANAYCWWRMFFAQELK